MTQPIGQKRVACVGEDDAQFVDRLVRGLEMRGLTARHISVFGLKITPRAPDLTVILGSATKDGGAQVVATVGAHRGPFAILVASGALEARLEARQLGIHVLPRKDDGAEMAAVVAKLVSDLAEGKISPLTPSTPPPAIALDALDWDDDGETVNQPREPRPTAGRGLPRAPVPPPPRMPGARTTLPGGAPPVRRPAAAIGPDSGVLTFDDVTQPGPVVDPHLAITKPQIVAPPAGPDLLEAPFGYDSLDDTKQRGDQGAADASADPDLTAPQQPPWLREGAAESARATPAPTARGNDVPTIVPRASTGSPAKPFAHTLMGPSAADPVPPVPKRSASSAEKRGPSSSASSAGSAARASTPPIGPVSGLAPKTAKTASPTRSETSAAPSIASAAPSSVAAKPSSAASSPTSDEHAPASIVRGSVPSPDATPPSIASEPSPESAAPSSSTATTSDSMTSAPSIESAPIEETSTPAPAAASSASPSWLPAPAPSAFAGASESSLSAPLASSPALAHSPAQPVSATAPAKRRGGALIAIVAVLAIVGVLGIGAVVIGSFVVAPTQTAPPVAVRTEAIDPPSTIHPIEAPAQPGEPPGMPPPVDLAAPAEPAPVQAPTENAAADVVAQPAPTPDLPVAQPAPPPAAAPTDAPLSPEEARAQSDVFVDRGEDALRAQRLDEARAAFEQAADAYDLNPHAHEGLARVALASGDAQAAVAHAERAANLRRRRSEYQVLLGDARRAAGDVAGARQAYERALEIAPDDADARARLQSSGD